MTRTPRRGPFAARAAALAASIAAARARAACAGGCGRAPAPPPPPPAPPAPPAVKVPRAWDPTPEEIAAAPESLRVRVDEYVVRFLPGPSRATLARRAEVFRLAHAFLKGAPPEQEAAAKALRELRIPTARFLVAVAGAVVPKAERPKPDPESWDPAETPEDRALEIVKDVMVEVMKAGRVDEMMEFFAAATGQAVDLDAELSGKKFEFRVFRVHPKPALFSVGDALGCDMRVIDPDLPVIPLLLPVALDMRIVGEDVRWLLESFAKLGKFRAELADGVRGPVGFRIRARTYADAFRGVAAKAGYRVEEIEGGFRVGP
ncbi:MAG: hypothetical protein MUC63_07245 [Planctomycetes bacterium]|nr:hypothetical protein [Planctomycetota bacterium]